MTRLSKKLRKPKKMMIRLQAMMINHRKVTMTRIRTKPLRIPLSKKVTPMLRKKTEKKKKYKWRKEKQMKILVVALQQLRR